MSLRRVEKEELLRALVKGLLSLTGMILVFSVQRIVGEIPDLLAGKKAVLLPISPSDLLHPEVLAAFLLGVSIELLSKNIIGPFLGICLSVLFMKQIGSAASSLTLPIDDALIQLEIPSLTWIILSGLGSWAVISALRSIARIIEEEKPGLRTL